jgi:serine/threonine protein kinase
MRLTLLRKPTVRPLSRGYILHGYCFEKPIGGGGFSQVYLATALDRHEPVVIKEYLPSLQARRMEDQRVEPASQHTDSLYRQGIKRFFEEASALAHIRHPNIVQVLDIFRANNTVYMVMRFEQGHDLRWYIKRKNGGLSERFLRTVFPPLLLGLKTLHDHQMLHLDIKPANILLRPGGNPLLLDFGAVRPVVIQRKPPGPHTLTVGFAPIEQHQGGHLGPWTDLYAIGASMLTCISGRPPPPATKRVAKDRYRPAARLFAKRYSAQLLEAIDWCLQLHQLERPQNVQALLDFLDPARRHEPAEPEGGRLGLRLPWIKA